MIKIFEDSNDTNILFYDKLLEKFNLKNIKQAPK